MQQTKRKTGRPLAKIDWDLVVQLLKYQNSGIMIASRLGIHEATLYDAVQREHGLIWSEYARKHQEAGLSALLQRQFERALCAKRPSDDLLKWLGKQKLGQRERFPEEIATQQIYLYINDVPATSPEA